MPSEVETLRAELDRCRAELAAFRTGSARSTAIDVPRAMSGDDRRSEALLDREKRLLEMIATHQPLSQILEALCRNVEEVFCGALAIVFLFDSKSNRLRAGAAPSMPTLLTE